MANFHRAIVNLLLAFSIFGITVSVVTYPDYEACAGRLNLSLVCLSTSVFLFVFVHLIEAFFVRLRHVKCKVLLAVNQGNLLLVVFGMLVWTTVNLFQIIYRSVHCMGKERLAAICTCIFAATLIMFFILIRWLRYFYVARPFLINNMAQMVREIEARNLRRLHGEQEDLFRQNLVMQYRLQQQQVEINEIGRRLIAEQNDDGDRQEEELEDFNFVEIINRIFNFQLSYAYRMVTVQQGEQFDLESFLANWDTLLTNVPFGDKELNLLQVFASSRYAKDQDDVEEDHRESCAICYEAYQYNDTVLKFPSCNHLFHQSCLSHWIAKNNTCPFCKNKLRHELLRQLKNQSLPSVVIQHINEI